MDFFLLLFLIWLQKKNVEEKKKGRNLGGKKRDRKWLKLKDVKSRQFAAQKPMMNPQGCNHREATDNIPAALWHECSGHHCVMETLWKPTIVIVSNHKGISSSLRMFYNPKLNTLTGLMAKIKTRPLSKGYFFHSYRVNWKGGPSSVLLRQKTHGTHLQAPHWKPLLNSRALSHSTLVQHT